MSKNYILFNHVGENENNVTDNIYAGHTQNLKAFINDSSTSMQLKEITELEMPFEIIHGEKIIFSSKNLIEDDDLIEMSQNLMDLDVN